MDFWGGGYISRQINESIIITIYVNNPDQKAGNTKFSFDLDILIIPV